MIKFPVVNFASADSRLQQLFEKRFGFGGVGREK